MRKTLVLAIILRLLVIPFLLHPDIKTFNFQASFLKKGIVNIYPYLIENKKSLPLKEEFVYLPLTYFFLGGYQTVISPVLGNGFTSWLFNASQLSNLGVGIFRYVFFLKLPYLIVDIAIAFLLMKFFDDEILKKKAFTLWLFNPFTIILIYVFSNVDIIPVAISLYALYLATKKRLVLGSLFLGVAAGFKLFPILFLPFIFLLGKNLKEKLLIFTIPILMLMLIVLPFWSGAFFNSALVSGLTSRLLTPVISLGFGESLVPGIILLAVIFFGLLLNGAKIDNLLSYFLAVFLLVFSFSHYHIQWLLWVAPVVIILLIRNKNLSTLLITLALVGFLIPFLYKDQSMTVSLFKPYSLYFDLVPIPFVVVQKFYDAYSLQSILHSLFAGGSLVIIWKLFKKDLS